MKIIRQNISHLSAFTISEFCRRNSISTPTYYELKKLGRAPREMHLGAAVRISVAAERDWQAARENPVGLEAEELSAAAERRRTKSARAVTRCHRSLAKAT